jgi:DNA helicase-2/ATP-dependent DNA helicase PcrA
VLVRRRVDMDPIAAALRARGLPVEVVGLGGLLDTPEVRDLVSALRLVADPLAGPAAVRLLTGARWRLGVADLAALWARARELVPPPPPKRERTPTALALGALPGEQAEQAGLVDALDDPGPATAYSPDGFARSPASPASWAGCAPGRAPRSPTSSPTPNACSCSTRRPPPARARSAARTSTRSPTSVAEFAAGAEVATLPALLDYLQTAEQAEDGLSPGEVEVTPDRVQVLTVHAAKGLEWEVVAVPHLVAQVFPGRKIGGTWLTSPAELPTALRGDVLDLPGFVLPDGGDRRACENAVKAHSEALDARRLVEERRLFYVAVTRAGGCCCSPGTAGPPPARSPGCPRSSSPRRPRRTARRRGPRSPPPTRSTRPTLNQATALWPVDPLGARSPDVQDGAELVRARPARPARRPHSRHRPRCPAPVARPRTAARARGGGPGGLGRRRRPAARRTGRHPRASGRGAAHPAHGEQAGGAGGRPRRASRPACAARCRCPQPARPPRHAFHAWLEQRFGAAQLLDLDELPGAADEGAASDDALAALQEAFLASDWADRRPIEAEVPFETVIAGVAVRGRMDAVFADPDGGFTVVDWKTGPLPDDTRLPRWPCSSPPTGWPGRTSPGCRPENVRAAFHFVRADVTLRPADLLDADGLRALLESVPTAARPAS